MNRQREEEEVKDQPPSLRGLWPHKGQGKKRQHGKRRLWNVAAQLAFDTGAIHLSLKPHPVVVEIEGHSLVHKPGRGEVIGKIGGLLPPAGEE